MGAGGTYVNIHPIRRDRPLIRDSLGSGMGPGILHRWIGRPVYIYYCLGAKGILPSIGHR